VRLEADGQLPTSHAVLADGAVSNAVVNERFGLNGDAPNVEAIGANGFGRFDRGPLLATR
jgi:hypothetical protein